MTHIQSPPVSVSPVRISLLLRGLLILLLLGWVGCGKRSSLPETTYAEPDGWKGKNSVAGASVFKRMLTNQGYKVHHLTGLSRRAKRLQILVWFPTDLGVPSPTACDWIEAWLAEDPERLLIYFGRDCNPGEDYWKAAARQADPADAIEYRNRAALEKAKLDAERQSLNRLLFCPWFIVSPQEPRSSIVSWKVTEEEEPGLIPPAVPIDLVTRCLPHPEFSEVELKACIQEAGLEWESARQVIESRDHTPLLSSEDGTPFLFEVSRKGQYSGRIWVVQNASPVLNLGLTKSENRDFVSSLMDWMPYGSVGILVASHHVSTSESEDAPMEGFGMFKTWPINLVSFHVAILGLLLAVAYFPIFGRPRRLPERSTQDFGEHIRALGDAMRSTGDRQSALHSVAYYFRSVRGEPHHAWSKADARVAEPPSQAAATGSAPTIHSQSPFQETTS